MSGFDALTALAANAALSPSAVQALDLGVQIELLQAQLVVGDLLTATILAPEGGNDRLALLGHTVIAQLPPGLDPGQALLLQVTGFQGNQILVRSLGTVDPENPPPTVQVRLPLPPDAASSQSAVLTTILPKGAPAAPAAPAAPTQTSPASALPVPASNEARPNAAPQPASSAVAPPREVFVAASVRAAEPAAPEIAEPRVVAVAEVAAEVVAQDAMQLGLEARLVATHTAAIDLAELVGASPKANDPARSAPAPGAARPGASPSSPAATDRPRPAAAELPPPQLVAGRRPPATPEAALLTRLRVPLAPVTLSAAKLVANAATLLPRVLARLDAALLRIALPDARVVSLRTLLGFVQRLEPGNTRALPEQLAAYVTNFIDGAEGKLAAIVRALAETPAEGPSDPATSAPEPASAAPSPAPGAPSAAPEIAPPTTAPPPNAIGLAPAVAARVAERTLALAYDAKAAIVALVQSRPAGAPPELASALNDALTTVTALQLNVLNAQNADPNTIAIPLPVFYHNGGQPVQMRISRDAPRGGRLDAENFHIAFVLDTSSLGTVAIDMQTVGRAVSVSVKTEGSRAADRFRSTLDDLRGRLVQLRYRVASIGAEVAPRRLGAKAAAAPETRASASAVDLRA